MKKTILALMLISLIFLSGAAGCSQSSSTAKTISKGVDVSFSKDSPPMSIKVNQEFPIAIDVLNSGGSYVSLGEAKFYLAGIGGNLENVKTSLSNDRVLSKSSLSPDKLIFADKAKFTFALQNLLVMPLSLTSCYTYGTTVQANICVTAVNESAVCSIKGEKINSDSNTVAPVQVSSLTESLNGDELAISFSISNKLAGQIYQYNSDCDKLLVAKDYAEAAKKDKINVEITSSESGFTCKLQDPTYSTIDSLKGIGDVGKVICTKTVSKENNVSPFYIVLRYKYISSITQNLNILP